MSVGRSSRTPVKHYLLNSILGKVCGVISSGHETVPCRVSKERPMLMVDLCGGDGLSNEEHDASPQIMYKHCQWMNQRGLPSELTVIEKMENTFEQLLENCSGFNPEFTHLLKGDSSEYRLPELSYNQPAFIHCDPNTVNQIPITDDFVNGFNSCTTYLVTLGCNVTGIKRDPLEKRATWFEYVEMLVKIIPNRHDAVLFWLNRDEAQWAYLLSMPRVWSSKFTSHAVTATSKQWTKGVSAVSYRDDRSGFHNEVSRLFLTKEEYANR